MFKVNCVQVIESNNFIISIFSLFYIIHYFYKYLCHSDSRINYMTLAELKSGTTVAKKRIYSFFYIEKEIPTYLFNNYKCEEVKMPSLFFNLNLKTVPVLISNPLSWHNYIIWVKTTRDDSITRYNQFYFHIIVVN